jgi:hypothetical protein
MLSKRRVAFAKRGVLGFNSGKEVPSANLGQTRLGFPIISDQVKDEPR